MADTYGISVCPTACRLRIIPTGGSLGQAPQEQVQLDRPHATTMRHARLLFPKPEEEDLLSHTSWKLDPSTDNPKSRNQVLEIRITGCFAA